MATRPRSALITGASSGIGADLARVLSGRGFAVGIAARRADRLFEVVDECRRDSPGSTVQMWVTDLEEPAAADELIEAAWSAFDGIDVLINNAAIPGVHDVHNLDPDVVERVMQVNFHAPVRLTLAALPRMESRDTGTIVNVASLGGRLGIRKEAAYCASKFALCGWSESLALDLWYSPISVKLIIPGPVDTEIWNHPGAEPPSYDGPKVPAREVATGIADAIDSDRFEHYLPDMKPIAEYKTARIEHYMEKSIETLG